MLEVAGTVLEAAIADPLAHHDGYQASGPCRASARCWRRWWPRSATSPGSRPGPLVLVGQADPRHRESDVKVSRGHTTKQGSPLMRWALMEAIQHVPAGHPLRVRKDDVLARRGDQAKNIAKVAAARQLLTWVFYAMRDGQVRALAPPIGKARVSRPRTRAQRAIAGFTGPHHWWPGRLSD